MSTDVEAIIRRVEEMAKAFEKGIERYYEGPQYKQKKLRGEELANAFEFMVAQNPNWGVALAFTENGMEDWIKPYERIRGLR